MPKKLKDPKEQFPYVLEEDRAEYEAALKKHIAGEGPQPERPAVFYLRALTGRSYCDAQDAVMTASASEKGVDTKIAIARFNYEFARRGVVGWEGLIDEHGKPVPALKGSDGFLTDDSMAWITDFTTELATAVRERNSVSPEDLGKSDSPS